MKKLLAGVALLGTAVGAQAADLAVKAPYYKAPAVASVYDWTGFYLGANVGVGVGRDRTQHFDAGSADSFYLSPLGAIGGGQIGYNWQTNSFLGPLVFGIEADIQGADMSDDRTDLAGIRYGRKLDWFGTVRGRVGLATGVTLSYLTAGYAYGNTNTTLVGGGVPVAFSGGRSGWTWGTGVEVALGGNWTSKIEYLYLDLGDRTDVFAGGAQTLRSEFRENIFRVGLNYRIGGNGGYAPVVAANWAGFYLGGNFGSVTARDHSALSGAGGSELFTLAPDGLNGGVQAGYNWQAGNWVFGLETDIQASLQEDNKTCILSCSALSAAAYDATLPWLGTVRGRLGYAVGPTLFYATGGFAYGSIKTEIGFSGFPQVKLSETRGGWTVGGGVETPFTFLGLFGPNWTSKTEYLYVDLGTSSDAFTVGGIPLVSSTHVTEHMFRTGLNYHFNSPVVAKY